MPARLTASQQFVIERYSRAVLHMRRQLHDRRRLTPVLGAGIGLPLRFPGWNTLADNIARHSSLEGAGIEAMADVHRSPTYRVQVLFEHLRSRLFEQEQARQRDDGRDASKELLSLEDLEAFVEAEWQRVLRDCLYPDWPATGGTRTPREFAELTFGKHSYLRYLVNVVRQTGVTITFNFDDVLERCIEGVVERGDKATNRGYETVVNAALPFGSDTAVIYHPNGYLPRDPLDRSGGQIVLTERTFADQLLGAVAGHQAFFSDILQRNTCLFIGLSLEDPTLRHLLRQNSVISPGHCHYFVRYVAGDGSVGEPHRLAERTANFESYNLVTLHLNDSQIAALLELVLMDSSEFDRAFQQCAVATQHIFFLTGVPGAGKTTSVSYLRSLVTIDEWLEQPPSRLAEPPAPPAVVTNGERIPGDQRVGKPDSVHAVDAWVLSQMAEKNRRLLDAGAGVFIVDRSILDPLSYAEISDADALRAKAEALVSEVRPGKLADRLVSGHVIVLTGEHSAFVRRLKSRERGWTVDKLEKLETGLRMLYPPGADGVSTINVTRRSPAAVAREIARIIYLGEAYRPVDMEARLASAQQGRLS